MRSDPHDLLRSGRALLADPKANAHQLGTALMNIHSALEQHFRTSLSGNGQVPSETRASVSRSKEIDWPQLLVLMATYGGLSSTHGETIRQMNIVRNGIAHRGETYRGTRRELERYADLAESLITGRERSFAGAEISQELYEASMAMLGMDSPPKQRTVGDPPRSEPALPAADAPTDKRQLPAPAPSRSPDTAPSSRRAAPGRGDRGRLMIAPNTIVLAIVLIIVLILLLFSRADRGPSEPLPPTPTLGVPTGVIVEPLPLPIMLPGSSSEVEDA